MPYIAVKMWPRSKEDKQALAENITRTVAETLGYPQEYVTVSIEEIAPAEWETTAVPEMEAKHEHMYIVKGEKTGKFDS